MPSKSSLKRPTEENIEASPKENNDNSHNDLQQNHDLEIGKVNN